MSKMSRMATIATMATLVVVVLAGGVASATTLRADSGPGLAPHHGNRHHLAPPAVFGVVASVNGTATAGTCGAAGSAGAFVVSGPRGAATTVDVSTTTAFVEQGVSAPTFADVCVGDRTGAFGTDPGATFTARVVFVAPSPTPTPRFVSGMVASVNGTSATGACGTAGSAGSFVLDAFHAKTITVDVTSTTTFAEPGVASPTFADVCVGERVGASGIITSGTMAATSVFITPPPAPKPHAVFGTVASVNGIDTSGACGTAGSTGAFVLTAFHKTGVTVDVSTTTTFSEHGVASPTFADACVGERVGAFGIVTSGTMAATGVFITPQPRSPPADLHPSFVGPKASPKVSGPKFTVESSTPPEHNRVNHDGVSPGSSAAWSQHSNHGTSHGTDQNWGQGSGYHSH